MNIERYNYYRQFDNIDVLLSELKAMILNGNYILTDIVEEFETKFSQHTGVSFTQGVNSGTDALVIALKILGIGKNDEVITQANTFYATVAAIKMAGAVPVLVDADEKTYNISVEQLDSAITKKTKAILPVHLYGKPAPMECITQLCTKNNLFLVEDAAQAHGATINNKRVGSFGDIGCFSFHPSKNLAAAGDGGAIVTNSPEYKDRISIIRTLGQKKQNDHVMLGCNSRLDALQAKILLSKLDKLDFWNECRRKVAELYKERLKELPLTFQQTDQNEEHVYHLFQIKTEKRDMLFDFLVKNGIDVVIRYPVPIHMQPAFSDCGWKKGEYPVSEVLSNELLCLPIRPDMAIDEIDYVCEKIKNYFG